MAQSTTMLFFCGPKAAAACLRQPDTTTRLFTPACHCAALVYASLTRRRACFRLPETPRAKFCWPSTAPRLLSPAKHSPARVYASLAVRPACLRQPNTRAASFRQANSGAAYCRQSNSARRSFTTTAALCLFLLAEQSVGHSVRGDLDARVSVHT